VVEAWFEDEHGERGESLRQGFPCSLCARVRFAAPAEDPVLAVMIENADHRPVFGASTIWHEERSGSYAAGEEVLLRLSFENWLAPQRYFANVSVARRGGGEDVMDRRERIASVVVTGTRAAGGLVDLPHQIAVERAGAAVAPVQEAG